MKRYWKNLKEHPGVPVAFMFTAMIYIALLKRNDHSLLDTIYAGLICCALPWAIVLITNHTNNRNN